MPQYGSCFVPPEKCDVKSVRRSYQSDNSEDAWNFLASASLVDAVAPPPPAMLRLPWSSDRTRATENEERCPSVHRGDAALGPRSHTRPPSKPRGFLRTPQHNLHSGPYLFFEGAFHCFKPLLDPRLVRGLKAWHASAIVQGIDGFSVRADELIRPLSLSVFADRPHR